MKQGLLYLLGAILLVLIVSVAWWSREMERDLAPRLYTVGEGETAETIATDLGVGAADLAAANNATVEEFKPRPGHVILVPAPELSALDVWKAHLTGLVAEVLGVLMSFWLALVAGLLPATYRRQILGIALVLGVASYAASHGIATGAPQLTPQFVFGAIKDGFAWSAAFPLFARAFGFGE